MVKLKAFTLMELLVGMVISALLISFCYASYSIIYRQYLAYKSIKEQLVKVMELNTVLSVDFTNAEIINYNENRLTVNRKNRLMVEYEFTDAYILRKESEIIDTFKMVPTGINVKYVEEPDSPLFFLTNFSFNALLFGENEQFHFMKHYSAETILNNMNKHPGKY